MRSSELLIWAENILNRQENRRTENLTQSSVPIPKVAGPKQRAFSQSGFFFLGVTQRVTPVDDKPPDEAVGGLVRPTTQRTTVSRQEMGKNKMDYYDAYGSLCLGEFLLHAYRRKPSHALQVTGITVEGQLTCLPDSFWESLQACFPDFPRDADASPGDWFDRLATIHGTTRLDYQLRWYPSGEIILIAVSLPASVVVRSRPSRQRPKSENAIRLAPHDIGNGRITTIDQIATEPPVTDSTLPDNWLAAPDASNHEYPSTTTRCDDSNHLEQARLRWFIEGAPGTLPISRN